MDRGLFYQQSLTFYVRTLFPIIAIHINGVTSAPVAPRPASCQLLHAVLPAELLRGHPSQRERLIGLAARTAVHHRRRHCGRERVLMRENLIPKCQNGV